MDELRRAIPNRCFQRSSLISLGYLARDLLYVSVLAYGALQIPCIQDTALRLAAWTVYGFFQGLVGTGIWILAHECGHNAFSSSTVLDDALGWILHSSLLVPYFSWKITHARHHRYHGHMGKDTAFVPLTETEFAKRHGVHIADAADLMQDTPLITFFRLIGHQILGWQLYLFNYQTGGQDSLPECNSAQDGSLSHLDPYSPIFMRKQRFVIFLSDLGLFIMSTMLLYAGMKIGFCNLLALYFVPYLWIHHWIGQHPSSSS